MLSFIHAKDTIARCYDFTRFGSDKPKSSNDSGRITTTINLTINTRRRGEKQGDFENCDLLYIVYLIVSCFTSTNGPISWSPPNVNISVTHLVHVFVVPPTPSSETPFVRRGYPDLYNSGKPTHNDYRTKTIPFVRSSVFQLRTVILLAYLLCYFVTVRMQPVRFQPRLLPLRSDRRLRCTFS
jgi:hypothetical protein